MTLLVVDPICGMRIDPADAVASLEVDGATLSFCSTTCRDAYLRSPDEAIRPGVDPRLTERELADLGDADVDRIRQLTRLGILRPVDGRYDRVDVMRVRVAAQLEAIGFEPEALAEAAASGHLSLGYLESAGRRQPRAQRTFGQLAEVLVGAALAEGHRAEDFELVERGSVRVKGIEREIRVFEARRPGR